MMPIGLTRITFPGYTHDQLMKIIQSRLEGVPGKIVDPDAVQFASRKVAAVSGDARRALDICRRAVEIAEAEGRNDTASPQTPSKKRGAGKLAQQEMLEPRGMVTIATVKQAITEATSNPLQHCLRCLPLSSKLLLAAVLANIRRTGIGDCVLGDVVEEAKRIGQLADNSRIHDFILNPARPATAGVVSPAKMSKQKFSAPRALAMGVAAVELMEAGIVSLEARKGERTGKIRLNVGEEEVKIALRDDPDVSALGFSS